MKQPEQTRAEVARQRLAALSGLVEATDPPPATAHRDESASTLAPPKPLTHRHVVVVAAVLAAAAVLVAWWLLSGKPQKIQAVPKVVVPSATTSPAQRPASARVVVDVVGKVKKPGIVELAPGSRVIDAVEAAGGLKGKPETASLNMARVLSDGEQIIVGLEPAAGAAGAPAVPGGLPAGSGAKLNLNVATADQLDALPGVGPVTASAILAWREEHGRFTKVEELLEVKGIGPATMADLAPRVMV